MTASTQAVLRRTETLLERSKALGAALETTLAESRWVLHLPPRTIRGGRGLDAPQGSDRLRPDVRRRLVEGSLPFPPKEPWAGRGTGEQCVICAAGIAAEDVEYELNGDDAACSLYAHIACYLLWQQEARAVRRLPP